MLSLLSLPIGNLFRTLNFQQKVVKTCLLSIKIGKSIVEKERDDFELSGGR